MTDDQLYTLQEWLKGTLQSLYALAIANGLPEKKLTKRLNRDLAQIDRDFARMPKLDPGERHTWAEWDERIPTDRWKD